MAADAGAVHAEHAEQLIGSMAPYACGCSLPPTGAPSVLALLPLKTGVTNLLS